MKVIFLDIDGCLNSVQYAILRGPIDGTQGFSYRTELEIDRDALMRLERAILDTNAYVVISSSWRICYPPQQIGVMFAARGNFNGEMWDDIILGCTPRVPSGFRGAEVQEWLDKHPGVDKYVIIDDDSDFYDYQKPRFVHTNNEYGLTDDHVEDIVQLLGHI